jgi:hypothetical protein
MKVINDIKLINVMEDFLMNRKNKIAELTKELMREGDIKDMIILQKKPTIEMVNQRKK